LILAVRMSFIYNYYINLLVGFGKIDIQHENNYGRWQFLRQHKAGGFLAEKIMNAKTYNKFKKLLITACDRHIKNGKKIISGGFSSEEGCCPISCVVVNDPCYFAAMNEKLGTEVPDNQYWDFIDGFDGRQVLPERSKTQLFKLGRALRKKYLGQ